MRRIFLIFFAIATLTACAPTGGALVSSNAKSMGGSLFLERTPSGQQVLVLDGPITAETSFVFQSIMEQTRMSGIVVTQSPGGDLLAAHQIGRTIKRRGMNTTVLVNCISACVDIFVAGRKREMTDIAELGLHSATNRDVSYQLDRKYWREMGFPTINEKAYRVPNNRLWIMDAQRAKELRLATRIIY